MFYFFFSITAIPALGAWVLSGLPTFVRARRSEDISGAVGWLFWGWIPVMGACALASHAYISASSESSFNAAIQDVRGKEVIAMTEDGARYSFSAEEYGVVKGDQVRVLIKTDPLKILSEVSEVEILNNDA